MDTSTIIAIIIVIVVIIIIIALSSRKYTLVPRDIPLSLSVGHTADALLFTCLDYRFLGRIVSFMNKQGLENNYDQFVLAGASLGLDSTVVPNGKAWLDTFWDHVKLAIDLHHIKRVIIIDHEDCGAYREFIGFNYEDEDLANPDVIPPEEIHVHSKYLQQAYRLILSRYPQLQVQLHMIGLKENIISIPAPTDI